MSDAIPDRPQVTNSEVTEALKVANQLGWISMPAAGDTRRITEMGMLQVLEAAFNARGERFNGELRQEARSLHRAAELSRIRLQRYDTDRDLLEWARRVQTRLAGLLEAIKDSRALRISNEFRSLELLLQRKDVGPPAEPDEIYTAADAAWDSQT